MPRGKGRPFGTFKYKDTDGNPISVFEWRKQNNRQSQIQTHRKIRKRLIVVIIPYEYAEIFHKIRHEHNFTKERLAEKIIIKYLKEKLKKED